MMRLLTIALAIGSLALPARGGDRPGWIDMPVYAQDRLVGEVSRVRLDDGEIASIMIDAGGREIEVGLDDAELVTRGGQDAFELDMTAAEIAALPAVETPD